MVRAPLTRLAVALLVAGGLTVSLRHPRRAEPRSPRSRSRPGRTRAPDP